MALLSKEDSEFLRNKFAEELNKKITLFYFGKADGKLVIPGNKLNNTECQYCEITHQLVEELSSLTDKIESKSFDLDEDEEVAKKYGIRMIPAIVLLVEGEDKGIRYYGIPSGHEFGGMVETIIELSSGTGDKLSSESLNAIARLDLPISIDVYITPTCPYCPSAVITAHRMAMASEYITSNMIEANEFPALSTQNNVYSVPHITVNGMYAFVGALPEKEFVSGVLNVVMESIRER